MTTKEVYKATLYELNKVNSPTFRLGLFNYFLKKALLDFENDSYSRYAETQEITDDIRALTKTELIDLTVSYRPMYSNISYSAIVYNTEGTEVVSVTFSTKNFNSYMGLNSYIQFDGTYLIGKITSIIFSDQESVKVGITSVNYDATKPALAQSTQSVTVMDSDYITSIGANGGIVRQFTLRADDYMHPLGVSCTMNVSIDGTDCVGSNNTKIYTRGVKRATYDMQTNIVWNNYLRPTYRRMYYYVYNSSRNTVTRVSGLDNTTIQNTPVFKIFMGEERKDVVPTTIEVSYLHLPGTYELTEQQLYVSTSDTSQVLELPDYTKPDIVKRIVLWIMGTEGDQRIQLEAQLNTDSRIPQQQKK